MISAARGEGSRSTDVRPTETARLLAALTPASRTQSRIVELLGEPGMGKTHMLAELTAAAERRRIEVWHGRSSVREQEIPFHAFSSIASGFRVAAGGMGPHELGRVRTWLGTVARNGLVIVFDDFHWADRRSVVLLDYLIRWPVAAPLLIVVAQRPRQVPTWLRATLAHGVELGVVERIELAPLTRAQAGELLGGRVPADRLPDLHRRGGGNPLYLLALAAEDFGFGADQARTLLLGDVVTLPPRTGIVALAAATLGHGFTRAELTEVSGLSAADVAATVDVFTRHDVVRPLDDGRGLALRHPALGDVIIESAEPRVRVAVQRRAIAVLRAQGARPAELAARVERDPALLDATRLAVLVDGAREVRWRSPELAERWLRMALPALPEGWDERRRLLCRLLGEALFSRGAVGESRQLLRQVLDETPTTAADRFASVSSYVTTELFLGHYVEARALLATEVAGTAAGGRPHLMLAMVEVITDADSAREVAERALALNRSTDDAADAFAVAALCRLLAGEVESAVDAITESAGIFDRLDDLGLADHLTGLGILGWSELLVGRFEDARRHLVKGVMTGRDSGRTHELPQLLAGLSSVCRQVGTAAEAVRAAREIKEIADRTGVVLVGGLGLALAALGMTWQSGRGDPAAAAATEAALAIVPEEHRRWRVVAMVLLSNALLLQGAADRCIAVLMDGCGGAELPDVIPVLRPYCFEMLTEAAVATGHPDAARWRDLAAASDVGLAVQRGHVAAARAHVLRAGGDHEAAMREYVTAAKAFAAVGAGYQRARELIAAAECAARLPGVPGEPLLAVASELAHRHGSGWLSDEVRRCRAALANVTGDVESTVDDLFAVLTERESEIARLVGAGRRTRDVAKQLALSPRTVDVHLSRIYRKLRIRSRTALARIVAEFEHTR